MDDPTKGRLTQFKELFIVSYCALKKFKRCYLKVFGSQINSELSVKVEEAKVWILAFYITRQQRQGRKGLW